MPLSGPQIWQYDHMKTTIELPDELFREGRAIAAAH
jgi:hypothetical protein